MDERRGQRGKLENLLAVKLIVNRLSAAVALGFQVAFRHATDFLSDRWAELYWHSPPTRFPE